MKLVRYGIDQRIGDLGVTDASEHRGYRLRTTFVALSLLIT